MLVTKLKTFTLTVLAIGVFGLSGAIGFGRSAEQQPGRPAEEKRIDVAKDPEEQLQKEVDAATEKVQQAEKALHAAQEKLGAAQERLEEAKWKRKGREPLCGVLTQVDVVKRMVVVDCWTEVPGECSVWVHYGFPLAAHATILQDNASTKLADLKKDMRVTVRFESDGKSVKDLTVDGGTTEGRFVSWNETRNTVVVTAGAKNERRVFHLLKDTRVGGATHVKDFKPGTRLMIARSVEDANTAVGIEAVTGDMGKTPGPSDSWPHPVPANQE